MVVTLNGLRDTAVEERVDLRLVQICAATAWRQQVTGFVGVEDAKVVSDLVGGDLGHHFTPGS